MPELARGEWEHVFEPWFESEARTSPAAKLQAKRPDSIFREASQPLAVRREDYIQRQSPADRALQLRSANVATEMERLVAYVERRHDGVEVRETGRTERPPLRDAPLRRLKPPSVARLQATATERSIVGRSVEPLSSPHPPAGGSFRTLLVLVALALVAAYAVYVQRSASERARRGISEAVAQSARAERMIAIIASPDARRIELSGSAAVPGAAGHVIYSHSHGVIVSATQVPRLDEGHIYQVWATMPAGAVSLGLASPDAHGRVTAAYELPADLPDAIRGFAVTQEPIGGSNRPTGRVVLEN